MVSDSHARTRKSHESLSTADIEDACVNTWPILPPTLKKGKGSRQSRGVRFGVGASDRRTARGTSEPGPRRIQHAQLGEASGLVNMTEEAPESIGLDGERQNPHATKPRRRKNALPNCRPAGLPE